VTSAIDAVLFDFGGVLVREGGLADFTRLAPGGDPDVVVRIALGEYGDESSDHPWHCVERGELSMTEWFRLTAAALAEHGIEMQMPGERAPVQFTPDEDMLALARDARAAGCRTAVVTNNARELSAVWRPALPIDELFDTVVDSSEVGVRKPGRAIFELTLERLGGVDASRAAFLDDVAANVEGARRAGLHAFLVESDRTAAIAAVRALLEGPPNSV
jgi:putative hydrolase of the HAD superfamily